MKETLDATVWAWQARYPGIPAYLHRAPKQKPRPYVIIEPAGDEPANAMAQICEVSDVVLRAFSQEEFSDEACEMFQMMETVMNWETVSVVGYTVSRLDRVGSNGPIKDDEDDAGGWMYEATYRYILTKA